jgi:hypothetical protein
MSFSSISNSIKNSLPSVAPIEDAYAYLSKSPSLSSIGTKLAEGASFVTAKLGSFVNNFGGISGAPTSLASAGTSLVSASQANAAAGKTDDKDREHIVTLTSALNKNEIIEFSVMPQIVENRSVSYDPIAPVQFPGEFQKYKGTPSVQWVLTATFVASTTNEASLNLKYLNILRAWTMPYFGENTKKQYPSLIGAPPPVLRFKGFRGNGTIGDVPVVITSLNWDWPKDVDYIPAVSPDGAHDNIPFPTVMQVTIQLVESFSTTEFNNFDRDKYLLGDMSGAFKSAEAAAATAGIEGIPNEEAQAVLMSAYVPRRNPNLLYGNEGKSWESARRSGTAFGNEAKHSLAISERSKTPLGNIVGGGGQFGGGGANGKF